MRSRMPDPSLSTAAVVLAVAVLLGPGETSAGGPPPLLSLDPSFGGDGTVSLQIAERDYAWAGFVEASGALVLFGESDPGSASFRVGFMQRLGADGSPGLLRTYPAQGFGCSAPRSIQGARKLPGGHYLTGGYIQEGCTGTPRLLEVQHLDANGIALQTFDLARFNEQQAVAFAVASMPDGRVVAAGLASTGLATSSYDFGAARFLQDGSIDPGFANSGLFSFDFDGALDYALGVAIDNQGRTLLAGFATTIDSGRDVLVLGLNPDGTLDPGFADGGVFRYDRAGFDDFAAGIAIGSDGRLLIAGASRPDADTSEFTVLALTPEGSLDPGFGSGGLAIVDFGSSVAGANAIHVAPDGLIYLAGIAEIGGAGVAFREVAVTVLRPDGTPDPRFNGGIGQTFAFGDPGDGFPADNTRAIDVDPESGLIALTGFSENATRTQSMIGAARLVGLPSNLFRDGFE